jgi:hypothetical protein
MNSTRKIVPDLLDRRNDRMFIINQYNYGDNRFIVTINTTKGTGSSFTLPTRSGYSYNCTVDWGDSSTSEITAYNDADITHTYASGGVYQIKISGTFQSWYFNNGGDKLKLTKIDNWGKVGFTTMTSAFYGCTNLTTIPNSAIGNPSINGFQQTFFGCTGLSGSIPADLFRYNVNVSTYGFQQTFFGCTGLTGSIPEDLFYYNSLCTHYDGTFYNCRNLVLPSRLFDLSNLVIVTTFENFMRVASTSYSFTGTIQDIWNYATGAISTNAFSNQTAISNYSSIPNGWKGL